MKTRKFFLGLLSVVVLLCFAIAPIKVPVAAQSPPLETGLIQVSSAFSVEETANRLETILEERHLTLFSRIDHARNAASVGKELRPTELFIFGNPAVGTPLMLCNQLVAIDLPQKILIWEADDAQVWLAYNDPDYLMARHDLANCEVVIDRIGQVLEAIALGATQA